MVVSPCSQFTAPCGLTYNSDRVQLESLIQLLCAAIHKIDGSFSCADYSTILASAEFGGLTCFSVGVNKALQAKLVVDDLSVTDSTFNCYSELQMEAIRTYLTCTLLNKITAIS